MKFSFSLKTGFTLNNCFKIQYHWNRSIKTLIDRLECFSVLTSITFLLPPGVLKMRKVTTHEDNFPKPIRV